MHLHMSIVSVAPGFKGVVEVWIFIIILIGFAKFDETSVKENGSDFGPQA